MSPFVLVVSSTPATLNAALKPGLFRGLEVTILMVEPIPPVGNVAVGVLNT